jgi:hypothetical protein
MAGTNPNLPNIITHVIMRVAEGSPKRASPDCVQVIIPETERPH